MIIVEWVIQRLGNLRGRLVPDERGSQTTEYAMMAFVGLVVAGIILVFFRETAEEIVTTLGRKVKEFFT